MSTPAPSAPPPVIVFLLLGIFLDLRSVCHALPFPRISRDFARDYRTQDLYDANMQYANLLAPSAENWLENRHPYESLRNLAWKDENSAAPDTQRVSSGSHGDGIYTWDDMFVEPFDQKDQFSDKAESWGQDWDLQNSHRRRRRDDSAPERRERKRASASDRLLHLLLSNWQTRASSSHVSKRPSGMLGLDNLDFAFSTLDRPRPRIKTLSVGPEQGAGGWQRAMASMRQPGPARMSIGTAVSVSSPLRTGPTGKLSMSVSPSHIRQMLKMVKAGR